jgi:hypothetical protein
MFGPKLDQNSQKMEFGLKKQDRRYSDPKARKAPLVRQEAETDGELNNPKILSVAKN